MASALLSSTCVIEDLKEGGGGAMKIVGRFHEKE